MLAWVTSGLIVPGVQARSGSTCPSWLPSLHVPGAGIAAVADPVGSEPVDSQVTGAAVVVGAAQSADDAAATAESTACESRAERRVISIRSA
jgi:hypothetical protein